MTEGPIRVDDDLRSLVGASLDVRGPADGGQSLHGQPSSRGVRYRIEHQLGEGGTGVAFMATRQTLDGESPHVVKVFRPLLLLRAPEIAEVSRKKEEGAMQKINSRVPPSPYVVRMTDSGEIGVTYKDRPLVLPWIAAEFVNGGPEGTTLTERLTRSVEATGVGFDPERVLRTMACIVEGLNFIHELGLIHRDIKPDNVLLCGFAETEVAKITDFGVARAQGLEVTFGPQPVGTIGYAAPEQLGLLQAPPTQATDVFALGVLLYRILAADEYFRRIQFAQLALRKDDGPDPRPNLKDAPRLHPELQRNPHVVAALDAVIRKATAVRPDLRFPNARALFGAIEGPLRSVTSPQAARGRRSATRERLRTVMLEAAGRTSWTTRHRTGDDRVLRAIAWEPDGRALGVGPAGAGGVGGGGLAYWDGQRWHPVSAPVGTPQNGLHFALRAAAGRFVVGGQGGLLLELSEQGWTEISAAGDPSLVFDRAAGTLDGMLLLAGSIAGAPALYVAEQRRWRTTLMIPGASAVNGIGQLDETRWVLVGRATNGQAYISVYDAAQHRISPFLAPSPRPLLAVASDIDGEGRSSAPQAGTRGIAYAVGPGGVVVAIRSDGDEIGIELEACTTTRDISAVAIDPAGIAWAAAQGRILKRMLGGGTPKWESVHNFDWLVPVVGLSATGGSVFAATVDGAVLEGRTERFAIGSLAPPTRP
ncbi:MAG: serine/threonine protein kinase [Myxococcales bacterium]|nr:serine/threonine protein kinase [Myxococcales bacterium]